jgi:hypothetical protein
MRTTIAVGVFGFAILISLGCAPSEEPARKTRELTPEERELAEKRKVDDAVSMARDGASPDALATIVREIPPHCVERLVGKCVELSDDEARKRLFHALSIEQTLQIPRAPLVDRFLVDSSVDIRRDAARVLTSRLNVQMSDFEDTKEFFEKYDAHDRRRDVRKLLEREADVEVRRQIALALALTGGSHSWKDVGEGPSVVWATLRDWHDPAKDERLLKRAREGLESGFVDWELMENGLREKSSPLADELIARLRASNDWGKDFRRLAGVLKHVTDETMVTEAPLFAEELASFAITGPKYAKSDADRKAIADEAYRFAASHPVFKRHFPLEVVDIRVLANNESRRQRLSQVFDDDSCGYRITNTSDDADCAIEDSDGLVRVSVDGIVHAAFPHAASLLTIRKRTDGELIIESPLLEKDDAAPSIEWGDTTWPRVTFGDWPYYLRRDGTEDRPTVRVLCLFVGNSQFPGRLTLALMHSFGSIGVDVVCDGRTADYTLKVTSGKKQALNYLGPGSISTEYRSATEFVLTDTKGGVLTQTVHIVPPEEIDDNNGDYVRSQWTRQYLKVFQNMRARIRAGNAAVGED